MKKNKTVWLQLGLHSPYITSMAIYPPTSRQSKYSWCFNFTQLESTFANC